MRAKSSATAQTAIAVTTAPPPSATAGTGAAPTHGRVAPDSPAATAGTPVAAPVPESGDGPAPGRGGGARERARGGLLQAGLGVVVFSLTFPATAWGLEGFGPWALVGVRSVLAAVIAGGCLLALRVAPPARRHWPGLAVVALGVVLGFPLLTTLALETSTTAHAAVVVGLLPLTTALLSALRVGARPSRTFWAAALAGAAAVVAFTVQQSGGALTAADAYLFGALLVCAAGYTEGGRLARVMPGWQVIAWALVLCLPVTMPGAVTALAYEPVRLGAHSAAGVLWLAAGSQFLGMVVWYRGMASIGIPKASQLQLAQPLLTLVWSVLLLGELLTPAAPVTAAAVLVCIAVTQRARG
ncbi:DMT family transporter [Streptomyces sp. SID8499]|uniref:DMT family transporter n=1 Tax=Streptomyces sp. SID8499 TaxID=2706106 RepID=UPI0013CB3DED|nr:DMT family transporter [Streptomyces sp. SID8499]NED38109.1 EamA family transporter [Streptomyces sp. SID8499]